MKGYRAARYGYGYGYQFRAWAHAAYDVTREVSYLPYTLPVMAVLAMALTVWRRVMDKRARRWEAAG